MSLDVKAGTIKSVLKLIEEQSDFRFFYNSDLVDLDKPVNVSFTNKNIDEILGAVLSGTTVGYRVLEKNFVVLSAAEMLQQIVITGAITDNAGVSIPGVNVMVKGATTGAISDFNGKYQITVPNSDAVLVFSFMGYETQEVAVGDRKNIDVILKEDVRQLEEVVVVGYGVQKKVNLTGAVSQVTSEALQSRPITNVAQGLQGLMPGVNVTFGSGNPNDNGSFNIRGTTTINDGSPLILVDGIQMNVSLLNPNDIESISVLKVRCRLCNLWSAGRIRRDLGNHQRRKEGSSGTGYI